MLALPLAVQVVGSTGQFTATKASHEYKSGPPWVSPVPFMSVGIVAQVLSIVFGVGGKLLGASAAAQFTAGVGDAVA
jgi:hypothetical protein